MLAISFLPLRLIYGWKGKDNKKSYVLRVNTSRPQAYEIEDIADRYSSIGKKIKLRHLTKDCHRLLSRTGQLMVDSDDDPDYGVAVDYEVKLGIFGK